MIHCQHDQKELEKTSRVYIEANFPWSDAASTSLTAAKSGTGIYYDDLALIVARIIGAISRILSGWPWLYLHARFEEKDYVHRISEGITAHYRSREYYLWHITQSRQRDQWSMAFFWRREMNLTDFRPVASRIMTRYSLCQRMISVHRRTI